MNIITFIHGMLIIYIFDVCLVLDNYYLFKVYVSIRFKSTSDSIRVKVIYGISSEPIA